LSPTELEDGAVLASIAARHVLRRALDDLDSLQEGMAGGPFSRREQHQASGMVAAQLQISVDDALVVLRGHAFATGRSVREVAADVVARRMNFQP
ncbi:ANTAR domain-containing protein, partial [Microbacterium sp. QXD-8]